MPSCVTKVTSILYFRSVSKIDIGFLIQVDLHYSPVFMRLLLFFE